MPRVYSNGLAIDVVTLRSVAGHGFRILMVILSIFVPTVTKSGFVASVLI